MEINTPPPCYFFDVGRPRSKIVNLNFAPNRTAYAVKSSSIRSKLFYFVMLPKCIFQLQPHRHKVI